MRLHAFRAVILALVVVASTGSAHAQSVGEGKSMKGNVAGTVGLGLLGAEVGLLLPPAFKLQDRWWAWVLFPTVTAAGGAVAGALAFDPGSPGPAVTLPLIGAGVALAIPAIVAAVALKNKRDNAQEALESGGVLHFGKNGRRWGVPAVAAGPAYTNEERMRYGVRQRSVVNVSLVSGRF